MTLREALKAADLPKVYLLINKKDQRNIAACDRPSLAVTIASYSAVVEELLSKPKAKPYKYSWLVTKTYDPLDKIKYPDVCFLNHDYVAPKKGLKPWGGGHGRKTPKGHYNCNANKHNRTFAAGWTPWSKVIDTPIINEGKFSLEKMLAELLWELTFYGWTEKKADESRAIIEKRLDEAIKEIDRGEYIEVPPKKEGGFKVVIANSAVKDITAISNKLKKKK